MNQKRTKALRRLARMEMLEDPERDIVASPKSRSTAMNSPNSVRGMYLQLKKAWAASCRAQRA